MVRAQEDSGFRGVILVAKDDSILLRRAYNGSGHTLSVDSRLWIASITKSFTAATILDLQAKGLLSVNDSLPSFFADVPQDKRSITLHKLLTHTAGFDDTNAAYSIRDRSAAVRAILSQPLSYLPGKGYRYGNDDYQLLAAIIEIVTHESWQDAVRKRILEPLSLKRTGFQPSVKDGWGHRGADGMASTADDLLKWSRALRTSSLSKRAFLGEISKPQVFVRKEPPFDISYSYGARIYERNGELAEVFHSGSGDDGQTVVVRMLDSGLTIIVLSDSGQHHGTTWASYVANRIAPRR